jgi:hypothetical protein
VKKSLFLFITFGILFTNCQRNELDIDVSSIEVEPINLLRLEKDLFSIQPQNLVEKTKQFKNQYGLYYEHYVMSFLNRRGTSDSLYPVSVFNFINDADVKDAFNYVRKLYPVSEVDKLYEQVTMMTKRFKYHFPEKKQPIRFITCLSGWNYAFAYMDTSLVIALDMYLGDTAKFYQMLRYPQYQTRKMNSQYILPDIAKGWLLTEFDNMAAQNTLVYHTIFYGKLFYAMQALLPNSNDSLIIGYTTQQMDYCKKYEKNVWGYFAEKNRLYENNMNIVRELTTDGPFTGAISKECPPRIAMWIGWRIIRSYMKNNPEVTLAELMADADAQKILNKSKYRP